MAIVGIEDLGPISDVKVGDIIVNEENPGGKIEVVITDIKPFDWNGRPSVKYHCTAVSDFDFHNPDPCDYVLPIYAGDKLIWGPEGIELV